MIENQMFVVLWLFVWLPMIAAILCMVLVKGKRLPAFGLLVAWVLINAAVFAIGLFHCWYGCADEPWYVLWSILASLAIGMGLLVLFIGWLVRWKTGPT